MQSETPLTLLVLDASEITEAVEEYLHRKRPEVLDKATGHSFGMDERGRVAWVVVSQQVA